MSMNDTTWHAIQEIARAQHGVLLTRQARAAGASDVQLHRAVASGHLRRVGRGILAVVGHPGGFRQRLLVAQLRLGPDALVSHRAAAWLHGLDGIERPLVELSTANWRDVPGAIVHERTRTAELGWQWMGPLAVTDVLHTLGDLGAVAGADVVERALESALRRRLVAEVELRRFARPWDWRGCRGMGVLQMVLDRRPTNAPPTGSDAETVCLQAVRAAGEPEPVRQHEVFDVEGRLVGLVDFAYPEILLGWEVDGFETHGTPSAMQYDLTRQNRIVAAGYEILRFTAADVYRRPVQVARAIRDARRRALARRARLLA
jgi:hypothetical protein